MTQKTTVTAADLAKLEMVGSSNCPGLPEDTGCLHPVWLSKMSPCRDSASNATPTFVTVAASLQLISERTDSRYKRLQMAVLPM